MRTFAAVLLLTGSAGSANAADDLFALIHTGDTAAVIRALKRGAVMTARDQAGATPLLHAAVHCPIDCVKALLDHGADVNAAAESGRTALLTAVNRPDVAKLLVERGAGINAVSKDGLSAVTLAARTRGGEDLALYLIAKGAKPNRTTLRSAAVSGHVQLVQALLKAKVELDGATANAGTALASAVSGGNVEIVRLLLAAGADPNTGPQDTTTLMSAAYRGSFDILKRLLDSGANVNRAGVRRWTPLMMAAGSDTQNPAVIRLLLGAGADTNVKDDFGQTAADWARKVGNPEVMRLLGTATAPAVAVIPAADAALPAVREAVQKAVQVLQPPGPEFFKKNGCVSCHHQSIPQMAYGKVRKSGIAIDAAMEDKQRKAVVANWSPSQERLLGNDCNIGGFIANVSYGLVGMAADGQPASPLSDSVVHCLSGRQEADGSWNTYDTRPPLGNGRIKWTALSMRAVQLYTPPGRSAEYGQRIARARVYLSQAEAPDNQSLAFQILGLHWAGGDRGLIQRLAKRLAGEQRSSGGWAQRKEMEADPYATGQALWALHEGAGMGAGDTVYQRGSGYLRRTQKADGSWHVKSRAFPFQPLRDTGFPHDNDQWISSAATGFAVMALAPLLDGMAQARLPAPLQ